MWWNKHPTRRSVDSIFFPRSNICQLSRTTSIFGMKILNSVKICYAEILISGETPQIHQKNRGFFGFHGNVFWETTGFSTIWSLQVLKLQRNKGFMWNYHYRYTKIKRNTPILSQNKIYLIYLRNCKKVNFSSMQRPKSSVGPIICYNYIQNNTTKPTITVLFSHPTCGVFLCKCSFKTTKNCCSYPWQRSRYLAVPRLCQGLLQLNT